MIPSGDWLAKMKGTALKNAQQEIIKRNDALQTLGLDLASRWRRRRGEGAAIISVGTNIEARYGGQSKWFNGVVTCHHGGGGYNIQYDDGDIETEVPRQRIRLPGEDELYVLRVGMAVDGYHGGGQKAYPGVGSGAHPRQPARALEWPWGAGPTYRKKVLCVSAPIEHLARHSLWHGSHGVLQRFPLRPRRQARARCVCRRTGWPPRAGRQCTRGLCSARAACSAQASQKRISRVAFLPCQ